MDPSWTGERPACVELFWVPLGAGDGGCVRFSGRVFEALVAHHEQREPGDLYHSALQVTVDGERSTIEMTPVWGSPDGDRGVVGEGAVGLAWLGRSRYFRYEVRRWRDGAIPDASAAVGGPRRVSEDPVRAREVLRLVPSFPTATWGRDGLRAGEMWNSNSLIAWLLARSGHDMQEVTPPAGGRAPGWDAGLVVAVRQASATAPARSTGFSTGCARQSGVVDRPERLP